MSEEIKEDFLNNQTDDTSFSRLVPGALLIGKIMTSKRMDVIEQYGLNETHVCDPQFKQLYIAIKQHKAEYDVVPDKLSIFQDESLQIAISCVPAEVTEPDEYIRDIIWEDYLFHKSANILQTAARTAESDAQEGVRYLVSKIPELTQTVKPAGTDIIHEFKARLDEYKKKLGSDNWYYPTGFPQLDDKISGWAPGEELVVLFARTGVGKEQPLYSNILTPTGWIKMGNISVGDTVYDKDLKECKVVNIFPQGVKQVYRVFLKDGSHADCGIDHLWTVSRGKYSKTYETITTCEVMNLLNSGQSLFIPNIPKAVEMQNGMSVIERTDIACKKLRHLGSFNGSYWDVYCGNYREFKDLVDLLRSLSYIVEHVEPYHMHAYIPKNNECRELDRIEEADVYECQCIMVDSPSHTYITDNFIVTHNTWILTKMLTESWQQGYNVGLLEPEMTGNKIGYRFDALLGHFSNSELTYGRDLGSKLSEYEKYLEDLSTRTNKFVVCHPKDFGGTVTVSAVKQWCITNDVKILGIDGISYMKDERGKSSDSTTIALTNISADLMEVSIELGIPIIIVVQSNREGAALGGKLCLENIRDSDGIAYSASMVIGLYQKNDALHMSMLKNRNGPNDFTLAYDWDINIGKFQFLQEGEVDNGSSDSDNDHAYSNNSNHSNNQQRPARSYTPSSVSDYDEFERHESIGSDVF